MTNLKPESLASGRQRWPWGRGPGFGTLAPPSPLSFFPSEQNLTSSGGHLLASHMRLSRPASPRAVVKTQGVVVKSSSFIEMV